MIKQGLVFVWALFAGALSCVAAAEDRAIEPIRVSVDMMLATTLLDPLSVIDYRVSDRVNCKLALAEISYAAADCICYSLNAKNALGAYSGRRTYASQFVIREGVVRAMPGIEITEQDGIAVCEAASFEPRAADNISQKVSR